MRSTLVPLFVLIVALTSGVPVSQPLVHGDEHVYTAAVRSTVLVVTPQASGSGVLVDQERRWIVTNQHVVAGHQDVQVFFPVENNGVIESELEYYHANRSRLEIAGKVIAVCARRDLALIELGRVPSDVAAIPFGDSAKPGQLLHSIGNPSASDALWVYTNGHVRANYFKTFNERRMQVVETSAPINPGDSGGPILNSQGHLVGISQSFNTEGRLVSIGVDICEVIWFVNKQRRQSQSSVETRVKTPESGGTANNTTADVAQPSLMRGLLAGAKQ
jgi:S1-C subfamily serine protease